MDPDQTSRRPKLAANPWQWLTEPAASIQDGALRRQSRLLSTILLVLFVLFALLNLSYYLSIPDYALPLPDLSGYIFMLSAYTLNRANYHKLAAWLTVSMVPIVLFLTIITNTSPNPTITLSLLVLGMLLSSIFLSTRETVILAVATMGGILAMPLLAPAVISDTTTLVGPLAVVGIGSALILIAMDHRRRMEEERRAILTESEERFRAIYNGVNEAICMYEASSGAVLSVNRKMCQMYGYSAAEFARLSIGDLSAGEPPYSQAEARVWINRALAGETPVFEWLARDKQDRLFWVEINLRRARIGRQDTVLAVGHEITARKKNEAEMLQEKKFSEALLSSLPDIFYVFDARQRLIRWNREFEVRSGYSKEEMRGRSLLDWFRGEAREKAAATVQRALAGEKVAVELPMTFKDGRQIPYFLTGVQFEHPDGSFFLGTGVDLTELRRSEEKFSRAFQSNPDSITITSLQTGLIIEANEGFERIFGYSRAEAIGQTVPKLRLYANSEDRDRMLHILQEQGRVRDLELTGRRRTGELLTGQLSAEIIELEGEPCLVTTVKDITERKQAEEEIRRRNRELTLLNQLIAATAASLEVESILQTVCRELTQIFEMNQAVAVLANDEKTELEIVAEYRPADRPSLLGQSVPIGDNPLFTYLVTHSTPLAVEDAQHDPRLASLHDLIRYRGTASVLMCPLIVQGKIVGGLSLGANQPRSFSPDDLNLVQRVLEQIAGVLARVQLEQERRELEAQYQQAQKMEAIGQLTAGVAHDFNNLLTAMNGFAELLHSQLAPDSSHREMAHKILQAGRRAADLVRQLLAFSRKQIVEPQRMNLNTAVLELDKMLRRIIGEDVHLELKLAPDLGLIKMDPAQMEQIIINLAVNARDAMPDGGRLTIGTSNVGLDDETGSRRPDLPPGEYVRLTVRDTGHGMSKAVKARIFEPFFTTKAVGKGTGLGLSTVFGLIKDSGGDITVSSEEGAGATFTIYLPRERASDALPTPAQPGPQQLTGSETILVVEDEAQVRDLVQKVLAAQNYTVLMAPSGQEALTLAANYPEKIHLLLVDVIMPGMSGKTLAESLQEERPDLKILFMSGYTDNIIAYHGVLEPGVNLVQKPFSPVGLARKVRQVLDEAAP